MKSLRKLRKGISLLEVMASTVLASLLLVPMGRTLVSCSQWSNRMEYQEELQTLAESCLEQTKFELAKTGQFTPGQKPSGNFGNLGLAKVQYEVRCARSNQRADADIAGNYLDITIRVWADLNGDGSFSNGVEPQYTIIAGFAKP